MEVPAGRGAVPGTYGESPSQRRGRRDSAPPGNYRAGAGQRLCRIQPGIRREGRASGPSFLSAWLRQRARRKPRRPRTRASRGRAGAARRARRRAAGPRGRSFSCTRATGSSSPTTRAPAMPRIRRRSCCAHMRAELAGARADDRDGLVASAPPRGAGATPSRSRSSARPARSRCTRASRRGSRPPRPTPHGAGGRTPGLVVVVEVLVVERQVAEPFPELDARRPRARPRPRHAGGSCCTSSRRRLPETARTLIASLRLDERELGDELHVVRRGSRRRSGSARSS